MSADPVIGHLIAKAYAALGAGDQGYKVRPQQQLMICRASALFSRENVGLVEAPTGTGKSAGYLIPGIITAALQDRVLIVSTATASLQDQLVTRDLPFILKAIESVEHDGMSVRGIKVATLKGRDRYVCPASLDNLAGETSDMFKENDPDVKMIRTLRNQFFGQAWDGTRDTLADPVPAPVWKKIANSTHTCTGRACTMQAECPYYLVQSAAKEARVLVTNHDYLLTSFARLPQSVLSDERAIYVFDEAHHLGDKIISAFAHTLNFADQLDPAELSTAMARAGSNSAKLEFQMESIKGLWSACERSAAMMLGGEAQHRFRLGEAPPQFTDLLQALRKELKAASDLFKASRDELKKSIGDAMLRQVYEASIGRIVGRLDEACAGLDDFCSDEPMARWISRGKRSVEICSSPFDPSGKARQYLWPKIKTALLTSATLASCGVFAPTLRTLGLPPETATLKLSSPFETDRAKVYVPKLAVEGNDKAHSRRVNAYVKSIVGERTHHQGVLVYFTNRTLMAECHASLPEEMKSLVLVQGQWSPSGMLTEHRSRIDKGLRSIIFGLDTVAEGIDLPGDYCTCVVVTRLPFPSSDDPVIATHSEHLRDKGLDPFNLITLPVAGRKFAQVCGRLMRRETDHGEILVLDQRLQTKRYGRRLMAGTTYEKLSAPA